MTNEYNCIIIDDESSAIRLLSSRLKKLFSHIHITHTYTRWDEAVNALRTEGCDILFIDIMMPEKSGLSLLRLLPALEAEVIFVTAHEEYAIPAFEFSPAGYLIKPVADDALALCVENALKRINYKRLAQQKKTTTQPHKIGIPNHKGIDYIDIADIIYLEAVGRYVKFITNTAELLSSYNISKYKKIVEEHAFIQVHRSYIINTNYIKRYESIGNIIMKNGKTIPLSRNYKDDFLKLFYKITHVDDLKKQ